MSNIFLSFLRAHGAQRQRHRAFRCIFFCFAFLRQAQDDKSKKGCRYNPLCGAIEYAIRLT